MREGGTLCNLSYALERLGRSPDSVVVAEAAVAVLEPLGPGTELAWAYARLASTRMLNSEHQAAIDLAVRVQAIAEPLGALDVSAARSTPRAARLLARAESGPGTSAGRWTSRSRRVFTSRRDVPS